MFWEVSPKIVHYCISQNTHILHSVALPSKIDCSFKYLLKSKCYTIPSTSQQLSILWLTAYQVLLQKSYNILQLNRTWDQERKIEPKCPHLYSMLLLKSLASFFHIPTHSPSPTNYCERKKKKQSIWILWTMKQSWCCSRKWHWIHFKF